MTKMFLVDSQCCRPVLSLHLRDDELAVIRAQNGCRFAHARCADMLGNRCAGVGYIECCQLLSSIEYHLLAIHILQLFHKGLVGLHIDGAVAMGAGQDATKSEGFIHLVIDGFVVVRMMSQTKAYRADHRDKVEAEHAVWFIVYEGRHDDDELVFPGIRLADVADESDMLGHCLLQVVGALISCLQEQGSGLAVHESKDAVVHVFDVAGNGPVEALLKSVERPQAGIVALGGDDLAASNDGSHLARQVIGTSHMSAEHGNDILPQTVDADHGRIFVLVLDIRRNGADANTHCPNEYKGIESLPKLAYL